MTQTLEEIRDLIHPLSHLPIFRETDSDRVKKLKEDRQHTLAKRDNLYFNFRYRKGSYKARKSGLQPILIMAKRGKDMIRVYGEADEVISPPKLHFASTRFKAWGQKERELKRLAKQAIKSKQAIKV